MRRVGWGIVAALALAACENDAYDKGEGKYSLMQADFVTAYTAADKSVSSVEVDDGSKLSLSTPVSTSWATVSDSAYRAILYYNKVGEGTAQPVSMSLVPTLLPISHCLFKEAKTAPVNVESIWRSKNGRYINIGMYVKVGHSSEDSLSQKVALMAEDTLTNVDLTRTIALRFYHDQGGIPEYYSQRYYVSIPTDSLSADSIRLTVNTYEGEFVKTVHVK